jgi:hypothetical protein
MARKISGGLVGEPSIGAINVAPTAVLTTVSNRDIGFANNIILNAQTDLRFADSDSSNWVAFQAPLTIASDVTWTLPNADGALRQSLTTNGAGVLSWQTPTISIADNTTDSATHFLTLTTATSDTTVDTLRRSSTRLTFQPSTGLLTSTSMQSTSLGVGTAPSGTTGEIRATGSITSFFSSDIRFKENIIDIPNALETVLLIGGKLFDWTDDYIDSHGGEDGYFVQKQDFGVIAQDVKKAFPRAVRTREDGTLAVDYEKLSALAFAAIIELSHKLELLGK